MFTHYLRERFPLRIFGPAALGIAAAASWTSPAAPTVAAFIYASVLSPLLLLQFRLWDDLESRADDRAAHPERVLVRTPPDRYRAALTGLAILNLALFGIAGSAAAGQIAVLNLFFYVAYGRIRCRVSDRVWRFAILLLKYPAFVVVLATGPTQPGRLAAAALVAYLTACGYEALHGNRRLGERLRALGSGLWAQGPRVAFDARDSESPEPRAVSLGTRVTS